MRSLGPTKLFFLAIVGTAEARRCYNATVTSKPYEVLGRATVETQRGCEVRCDANEKCAGISFKDLGLASDCILLSPNDKHQICAAQTEILLKRDDCEARFNLTAEFGVDPCIDERVDEAFRGIRQGPICTQDKDKMAVDSEGRRITLDNENLAQIVESGEMWQYTWAYNNVVYTTNIVAAVCAVAGPTKCPCVSPVPQLPIANSWPVVPEIEAPCNAGGWRGWRRAEVRKAPEFQHEKDPNMFGQISAADTAVSVVRCKAGLWVIWRQYDVNMYGVKALACT